MTVICLKTLRYYRNVKLVMVKFLWVVEENFILNRIFKMI